MRLFTSASANNETKTGLSVLKTRSCERDDELELCRRDAHGNPREGYLSVTLLCVNKWTAGVPIIHSNRKSMTTMSHVVFRHKYKGKAPSHNTHFFSRIADFKFEIASTFEMQFSSPTCMPTFFPRDVD